MPTIHYDKHEASRFLVENIAILPKGRVLDIAIGNGRNAVYLATMGFQVEGIDISPIAIESSLESARAAGVEIRVQVADLEGNYHIEKEAYDLIICFNYLQRSLIPDIRDGIRLGGMIVYETFIVDQIRFGKPRNPDHLLEHNELLHIFRDFRCLSYHEGVIEDRKAVAGIIAEKILRKAH